MDEKTKLKVLWIILAILFLGGLILASRTSGLPMKELKPDTVAGLLSTFFVLALFVERTLEVFITAWRGEETARRENQIQFVQQELAQNPNDPGPRERVETQTNWLSEYKSETQAIALRSGLVLGILIAAVGGRSFGTFFVGEPPANAWLQAGTLKVLDVLVSGGLIGGGSEGIHRMLNVIFEFFDATVKKLSNR